MRVAELISARVMNGAARHCVALSAALAERGHEVLLLHRPALELPPLPAGVTAVATSFRRSPGELRALAARLKDFRIEVIHTHMSSAHFHGALLRAFWGVPTVGAAHARHFQPHWLFNDRVIAPSRSTAAYHLKINRVASARMRVIPNFIDPDAYPARTPQRLRRGSKAARASSSQEPSSMRRRPPGFASPRRVCRSSCLAAGEMCRSCSPPSMSSPSPPSARRCRWRCWKPWPRPCRWSPPRPGACLRW